MGPASRIARPAAIAALALAAASCSTHTLLTDVSPAEAQRCAVVLRSSGVDVSVERDEGGGSSVRSVVVHGDDADYSTALKVLEEHNLPHRVYGGFPAEPSALIPTPTEERTRFIKALSGEIETMLESIDGVVAVEALVSIPERRPLATGPVEPATASIVISHTGAAAPIAVEDVRGLVVQCVGAALLPERVAVILKPVIRPSASRPIIRYQRDRGVEIAFLGAVTVLSAVELATLFALRRERARHRGDRDVANDA